MLVCGGSVVVLWWFYVSINFTKILILRQVTHIYVGSSVYIYISFQNSDDLTLQALKWDFTYTKLPL